MRLFELISNIFGVTYADTSKFHPIDNDFGSHFTLLLRFVLVGQIDWANLWWGLKTRLIGLYRNCIWFISAGLRLNFLHVLFNKLSYYHFFYLKLILALFLVLVLNKRHKNVMICLREIKEKISRWLEFYGIDKNLKNYFTEKRKHWNYLYKFGYFN